MLWSLLDPTTLSQPSAKLLGTYFTRTEAEDEMYGLLCSGQEVMLCPECLLPFYTDIEEYCDFYCP